MTCIVGLVQDGVVWMGADSAIVSGWEIRQKQTSKIFQCGDFLIGCSGNPRMGQLVRYYCNFVEHRGGVLDEEYMVKVFASEVHRILKEHNFVQVKDGQDTQDSTLLVGYRSNLYKLADTLQISSYADVFDAIGCGSEYALAAMEALSELDPKTRILRTLEISAKFSMGVRGPFDVVRQYDLSEAE